MMMPPGYGRRSPPPELIAQAAEHMMRRGAEPNRGRSSERRRSPRRSPERRPPPRRRTPERRPPPPRRTPPRSAPVRRSPEIPRSRRESPRRRSPPRREPPRRLSPGARPPRRSSPSARDISSMVRDAVRRPITPDSGRSRRFSPERRPPPPNPAQYMLLDDPSRQEYRPPTESRPPIVDLRETLRKRSRSPRRLDYRSNGTGPDYQVRLPDREMPPRAPQNFEYPTSRPPDTLSYTQHDMRDTQTTPPRSEQNYRYPVKHSPISTPPANSKLPSKYETYYTPTTGYSDLGYSPAPGGPVGGSSSSAKTGAAKILRNQINQIKQTTESPYSSYDPNVVVYPQASGSYATANHEYRPTYQSTENPGSISATVKSSVRQNTMYSDLSAPPVSYSKTKSGTTDKQPMGYYGSYAR